MSRAETKSRIRCDIDFDSAGRQAGYLRAPLSRNTSGWGTVEIPIVSVKNGSGPTVLFTGGVHGDEYEGQIAVSRLARTLDPATDSGARHHDSGSQHAGRPERHAPVAGRQPRPEPLLSGQSARHVLRDAGAFHRHAWCCRTWTSRSTCTPPAIPAESALSTNMHYLARSADAREDDGGGGGLRRAVQRRVLGCRRGRDA